MYNSKEIEIRIENYLHSQGITRVDKSKVEGVFNDLGHEVRVWNVKTDDGPWWVVEGDEVAMNLYSQNQIYLSAGEAYSYHMGIMQRMDRTPELESVLDSMPYDIKKMDSVTRKYKMAAKKLLDSFESKESEDLQQIGLLSRECLKDLGKNLKETVKEKLIEDFKDGDFKGISESVINTYIPGSKNSELRRHGKRLCDSAWELSNDLAHSPNRNYADAHIVFSFVSAVLSLFQNLFLKYIGYDYEPKCEICSSNDIEIEFIENDENHINLKCNFCNWIKKEEVSFEE